MSINFEGMFPADVVMGITIDKPSTYFKLNKD